MNVYYRLYYSKRNYRLLCKKEQERLLTQTEDDVEEKEEVPAPVPAGWTRKFGAR
jgi:hypothetical protein